MSKWIISSSGKSYTVEGKVIPRYSDTPLQVTDDVYEKIARNAVIKSLIKQGQIQVLSKYDTPLAADAANQKLQSLTTENAKLADRIRELEANQTSAEVSEKAAKFDELKAEAEKALSDKDAEIAELKAQLEAASKTKKSKKADEE